MKNLKIYYRPRHQKSSETSYLYCRIKLNGVAATDFSTFIPVTPDWNQESQIFTAKQNKKHNTRILQIASDIEVLLNELRRFGTPTVHDLRNTFLKRGEKKTLMDLYAESLKIHKMRIGEPGYSLGTFKAHRSLHNIMVSFLAFQKRTDIALIEIRKPLIIDFVNWLRFKRKYGQNYIHRNVNHFKAFMRIALADEHIKTNPVEAVFEAKTPPGEIVYLTEKEIELLYNNANLLTPGLERVADAFLFQCFTGLCYIDLKKFSAKKHVTTLQGRKVIHYARTKIQTPFTIPVLTQTEELLQKYKGNIPVLSNQKMNQMIKVIAKTVGIDKYLTTHIGRKTAGTFLLNNDVPLEVVSKILGHKLIKTTEKVYANLLQETILRHTAHLV